VRCAPDPRTELTLIPTALAIVRALGADKASPDDSFKIVR
jgi:hypothetical protein